MSLLFALVIDFFPLQKGTQPEREEKVSLELTEEILQSMETGMVFRDYVISTLFVRTLSYFCFKKKIQFTPKF